MKSWWPSATLAALIGLSSGTIGGLMSAGSFQSQPAARGSSGGVFGSAGCVVSPAVFASAFFVVSACLASFFASAFFASPPPPPQAASESKSAVRQGTIELRVMAGGP